MLFRSPSFFFTLLHFIFLLSAVLAGMHTRSNTSSLRASNNASERTVQRVRALAEEALRYTLFALRREILWAATRILEVIRLFDSDSFLNKNKGFSYSAINFDDSRLKIGTTLIFCETQSVHFMPLDHTSI